MSANKLDNFERFVNESLSGEEVAYNPSDWNNLTSRLDKVPTKPFYKTNWFLGGAASIIIGAGLFVYNTSINKTVDKEDSTGISQIEIVEKVNKKEKTTISKEIVPLVNENFENEIIKDNSSETISKEEIVEEKTTNNLPQSETSTVSSITNNKENSTPLYPSVEARIETPTAKFKVIGNTSGCKGLTVQFETLKQNNVDYLWSFGDGTYSSLLAPTHVFNNSGKFEVELIVQSTLDKGVLSKSKGEEIITVYNDPHLEILSEKYLEKGCPMVKYSFAGDEVVDVYWNLGNGSSSKEKEVETRYKKRGTYNVALKATNLEGCSTLLKKNIFIDNDYNLLAPSAFTPDGDGLNDVFIPEALKLMNNQFTMIIQSRTEGIVFETSSINRAWDGTNQKTGLECSEKNYIWVVNLINDKGEKEQYTGAVLIQR